MVQKAQPAPQEQSEFSQMIQAGHSLVRIENEHQQQISISRPRDERVIVDKLKQELELAPQFAGKSFYSIPFKKRQDDGSFKIQKVEGVSIQGAMAIQRRWGNCASAARVIEERADRIICEGVFLDYETNSRVMREIAVARFYKKKNSNVLEPLRADMLEKAVAAGQSKAVRNAVLYGVPEYVKAEFFSAAKQLAGSVRAPDGKLKKKPLQERFNDMIACYTKLSWTIDEIKRLLGGDKDKITEEDYENLLGTLNALEDGYITKEALLNPESEVTADPKPQPAEVRLQDLKHRAE